jgi:imidazolonepropionase-like amidohydrolase
MLRFGVTSALDMFSDPAQLADFRIDRESLAATDQADVWSAGALVTASGGHGTQFGLSVATLDSPSDAEGAVAARISQGSDFIKLVVDNGHGYSDSLQLPTLDHARYERVIAATRRTGHLAVVHVAQVDDALAVLEAGADGLVHVFSDRRASAEEIAQMARHEAFVIPTLSVVTGLSGQPSGIALGDDAALTPWLDAAQRDSLGAAFPPLYQRASHLPNGLANVAALHRAGVDILAGTDAGNPGTAHGASMHGELALLVSAGLTPAEALRAATALPARRFGLTDRGRIAVGLRADLLLVEGDPTQDIHATRRIVSIWKNGVAVQRQAADGAAAASSNAPILAALSSAFDGGNLQASTGQTWVATTDAVMGGASTALLRVAGSTLQVTGVIAAGAAYPWSGAALPVADTPMSATDASALNTLSFRLRGDGRELLVMLVSGEQSGVPAMQRVRTSSDWQQHSLPLASFQGADLTRLRAVSIAASLPAGEFEFELDEVELR